MADNPSVSEVHSIVFDPHGQRHQPDDRKRSSNKPAFPKPQERSPRQIADVASVLGIPAAELTPHLHEALTILLTDYDRVRWDLQVSEEHAARLEQEADEHVVLPALNRRSFQREIHRVIDMMQTGDRYSSLLYISLPDGVAVKNAQGLGAFDEFLKNCHGLIRERLEDVDLVGMIDPSDFAVLLNMVKPEQAEAKGKEVAAAFAAASVALEWAVLPLNPVYGAGELLYLAESRLHNR